MTIFQRISITTLWIASGILLLASIIHLLDNPLSSWIYLAYMFVASFIGAVFIGETNDENLNVRIFGFVATFIVWAASTIFYQRLGISSNVVNISLMFGVVSVFVFLAEEIRYADLLQ